MSQEMFKNDIINHWIFLSNFVKLQHKDQGLLIVLLLFMLVVSSLQYFLVLWIISFETTFVCSGVLLLLSSNVFSVVGNFIYKLENFIEISTAEKTG